MNALSLAAWSAAFFLSSVMFAHTVALRLLLLLLGAGFAASAVARDWRSLRILPPIWAPFVLWAAWAALSLLWSEEPARSRKEFTNEIVYVAFALWVCYIAAQARDAVRIVLPVAAAAATLACGFALYYWLAGFEAIYEGWHGGPGSHSSALLTFMPCAIALGWYASRAHWPRTLWLTCLCLCALFLVAAYTTQNRTIWLGFALEALVIGALLRNRRPFSASPWTKLILTGVTVAIVAAAVAMTLRVQGERQLTGGVLAFEKDPRLAIWPKVLEFVKQRPLTGYGFGHGLLRGSLTAETNDPQAWHAHNLFLEFALQLGLPGVVLLLLLLGATLREGWRFAFDRDDAAAACGIALIAIVIGMVVRNMTDTLWTRHNALFYWGVVGLLLGWGERYGASVIRPSRS